MDGPLRRLVRTALAAVVGLVAGCVGGAIGHFPPNPLDYPFLAEYGPFPHHVPKYKGGVPFRFAMAHHVNHRRSPKQGPANNKERNRLTREKLAKLPPEDPPPFPLPDDRAASLDRLGRSEEAVAVMRDKPARQQA